MRIRLAAVLAIGTMLAASACSGDEPDVTDAEDNVQSAAEDAAADTAAEDTESEADTGGGGLGACDSAAVTAAVGDILDAAGAELTADDSAGDSLSCTWETEDAAGPSIYLTAKPAIDMGMSEELLESMGQTPIDDERFASVDAILVEVLGCEETHAGSLVGCALGVYGSYDITLQALFAEAVTVDQMIDATWAITEQVY